MGEKEVVVIGGGIAGITSIVKLKELGYSPVLISASLGASYMFSGGYDVYSGVKNEIREPLTLKDQINLLEEMNPYHPYNFVNDIEDGLKNAFSVLNKRLDLNLTDLETEKRNFIIPTQRGTFKKTALVRKGMEDADLYFMINSNKRFGILNFTMFKDFDYNTMLYNLNGIKRKFNSDSDFLIVNFDFLRRSSDVNLNSSEFAAILEKDELYKDILEKIYDMAQKNDMDYIISPPVWGIDKYDEITDYLLNNKIKILETLGGASSIYGMRLRKKVLSYLNREKLTILEERVKSVKIQNGYIKSVITDKGKEIKTSAVIFCGGKFIGGGIDFDGDFKDNLFNLPVFYQGKKVEFKDSLFENDYFKKHKIFSVGIKINDRFQPLNEDDKPVYKNLFVAGNIISGYNYIFREGGMGVAVVSGYMAAKYLSHIV